MDGQVSVVVATRDRVEGLLRTLDRLGRLPEEPPVIVVDNASSDATADRVADEFPEVRLLRLDQNQGAAARTVGVRAAATEYVAFADDDSWWAPGALGRAAGCLQATPRLGLVAGRVLVGSEERTDPTSVLMAHSPLPPEVGMPGTPVMGFVACAAVVRRLAYLEVGGFDPLLFFLGEEQALAIDLAAAGWHLAYVDDVVAHHHPEGAARDLAARRRLQARNQILTAWTRRSAGTALATTARAVRRSSDPAWRGALADAVRRLPAAARQRRPPPPAVEQRMRLLERAS